MRFGDQSLVRSNTDGQVIPKDDAALVTLRSIMVDRANWYLAISSAASSLYQPHGRPFILSIGADAIPQSISKTVKVVKAPTTVVQLNSMALSEANVSQLGFQLPPTLRYPENAIAVIGMSCKFPGADSLDEFWQLLTDGTSMLEEMPKQRFSSTGLHRSPDGKLRFWGNFVRDIDAFDHRFFKKSSREAASMDPQQRLLLQAAYEAMESSGYFADSSKPRDVGCYLGACATDYDSNVGSHPPTAFSSLGTLRAFLSGKISHFFGWSGPSLTFDTACSSSAVAIHTACKALQTGECSQAVAGGVTLFTSPYLYENLSAAHFLSPTGATKPFDVKADGYCRGEGVGLVVLKKLSAAVADGDDILGVIAGSAVNQNNNCVPIMVPHSSSQSHLYQRVADQAGISPRDVSFVEAHGTGTPVGDPIEMESIRRVFGGPQRRSPLFVSSVKGNIGHLEGASGIAALIKTILQMENRTACVQASFTSLNLKIPPLEPDRIKIPTSNCSLTGDFLTACINNYGAAGSNAAMILMEPPRKQPQRRQDDGASGTTGLSKHPILISAESPTSLLAYCEALRGYCRRAQPLYDLTLRENLLPSLAFNLAKRQNQELSHALLLTSTDMDDLQAQLLQQSPEANSIQQRPKRVPLVLVFGGQVNNCVALSKQLWQQSSLLRFHLDSADEILRSIGYPGLYPGIFQSDSVKDIVALQCMVFAIQYSCARAWLDSGLTVDALVGHSLGQLTALCVSGVLSLRDGLKLVAGRASLMREHWGSEPGSMIAVEADLEIISSITDTIAATGAGHSLEIACYNGPTSHVVVGTEASANIFELQVAKRGLRYKRLNVTHGFHSKFTDPLIPHLQELASSLVFGEAKIPIETCSDEHSWARPTPELLADHTRAPVYFGQAVQRLESKLGTCTWLEAGSDSSVVGMVRRALDSSPGRPHGFQSIQLNKPTSLDLVADATVNLWRRGHTVQFWNFHRLQKHQYGVMRLPSYQFEKAKHWLELISLPKADTSTATPNVEPELPATLIRLSHKDSHGARFRVDSSSKEYRVFVQGHAVLGSSLCPAPLYIELASRAARMLQETNPASLLSVQNLQIESPLGLASDREIGIHLQPVDGSSFGWNFKVTSEPKGSSTPKAATTVFHASGIVMLQVSDLAIQQEFARYEKLTGHERIDDLYRDRDSELIQGAMVYKVFSQVVDYAEYYRGVKSVAAKNNQIAGTVESPEHSPDAIKYTTTQPPLLDSFMQVAGLHANSIYECPENEVYVFTKVDRVQFGPEFNPNQDETGSRQSWVVFALASPSPKEVANDIFVFDAASKRLVVLILGARFTNVRRSALTKLLSRVNEAPADAAIESLREPEPVELSRPTHAQDAAQPAVAFSKALLDHDRSTVNGSSAILDDICGLLERVAEVPRDQVQGGASFDDLGVDSLMMMELISEISSLFATELPISDLENLTDIDSLVSYLHGRGCVGSRQASASKLSSASTSSKASVLSAMTPSGSSSTTTPARTPSPSGVAEKLAKLVAEHLELTTEVTLDTNLADHGLDSLLCIELASDIKKAFSVDVDMELLDYDTTFGDLLDLVVADGSTGPTNTATRAVPEVVPVTIPSYEAQPRILPSNPVPSQSADREAALGNAQQVFDNVRFDFDKYAEQALFTDFWKKVYPKQAGLVLAYTVDAFQKLGCNLSSMSAGQQLPPVQVLTKHRHLLQQLHNILVDGGLIERQNDTSFVRTARPVDLAAPASLLDEMIQKFPWHTSESKLLNVTAARLAECLTGQADPLQLLFANKANKEMLADVYDNAPMCQATTRLLATFLAEVFAASQDGGTLRILEVGAGTGMFDETTSAPPKMTNERSSGGTARYLVDFLSRRGIPFEYTFTDISSALVAGAKKKFASFGFMKFMTLDVDRAVPQELLGRFDVVIATNCIHATTNATASSSNIRPLLRHDGVFALVEFTRGLYWFDLVYGLLDGWWLFGDGRQHALADEWFWDKSLRAAGFKHVSWTDGVTREAQTLRFICAFNEEAQKDSFKPVPRSLTRRAGIQMETVVWKRVGDLDLHADIYYPPSGDTGLKKRPIGKMPSLSSPRGWYLTETAALMLHGGGHVLYTRKDVHMKHVKVLLQRGFLPVSVDYRLCPEVTILEGPMKDACDALRWARDSLPSLRLAGPPVKIDEEKLAAVGWSSGGHLAMTLGYMAGTKGIRPPDVVLAFYCPSDFEADRTFPQACRPFSVSLRRWTNLGFG